MRTESNCDCDEIRFLSKANTVRVYISRLLFVKSVRDVHSGISRVVYPTGFVGRAYADYCPLAVLGRSCKQNSQQQHVLRSALFPATLIAAKFLLVELFPAQKVVVNLPLLRSVLRFCGTRIQVLRSNRAVNFTTPRCII